MKLVKSTKTTRFPKHSNSVENTFRRAKAQAQKDGWTKVIIVGQGPKRGSDFHSPIASYEVIGMLQYAIKLTLDAL